MKNGEQSKNPETVLGVRGQMVRSVLQSPGQIEKLDPVHQKERIVRPCGRND